MALSLEQQLANIAKQYSGGSSTAVLANGKTMSVMLEEEAMRLQRCIEKAIDNYYDSYTPHTNPATGEPYYERTYRLKNSLSIEPVKQVGNIMSIKVYFNENAVHPSILGGESGFVPILLTHDWSWKNDVGLYHFSYYDGSNTDFINNGIIEYNNSNPYGLKVELLEEWNGQIIENRTY